MVRLAGQRFDHLPDARRSLLAPPGVQAGLVEPAVEHLVLCEPVRGTRVKLDQEGCFVMIILNQHTAVARVVFRIGSNLHHAANLRPGRSSHGHKRRQQGRLGPDNLVEPLQRKHRDRRALEMDELDDALLRGVRLEKGSLEQPLQVGHCRRRRCRAARLVVDALEHGL